MSAVSDSVLALDRFQATKEKRECQANPRHGTLLPHANGQILQCGYKGCDYAEPVSNDILTTALALR